MIKGKRSAWLVLGATSLLFLSLTAGNCSRSPKKPTPPPTSSPAPSSSPTPDPVQTAAGLVGALPSGIVIADGELRPNIDVPQFHFPSSTEGHFNTQQNLESQFPRLAAWAECITKRRDQSSTSTAKCMVHKFELVEHNNGSGAETRIATFDFSKQRRNKPVECGFTSDDPPQRIPKTFCAGANYRREGASGQLCWYNWCYPDNHLDDDGMAPMSNGLIDSDGQLTIDAAMKPKLVSHWWSQTEGSAANPKTRSTQGFSYFLVIEVYTMGDAVLRVGADRWIDAPGGQQFPCANLGGALSENCELFFGNWLTDKSGNTTFKSLRFQLPS